MSEKKILLGFLSTTQKKTPQELSELIYDTEGELKEDALSLLLNQDKTRVENIKGSIKLDKEEIYGRATREVLTKSESTMKKFFGVESDEKGDELLNIIKSKLSESKNDNVEVTDEIVKSHPLYKQILTSKTEDIAKIESSWKEKFSNLEKENNQKAIFTTVNSKALAIVKSLNPILSESPEKAHKQLSVITNALKSYDFETKGDNIIVSQDGKIVEDEHSNQKTFKDIVTDITGSYYDFNTSQQRNGTGNNNDGTGANQNKKINSMDELREKMKQAKSPEERQQLSESFKQSQEQKKD
jgi:hypothetical protein